MDNPALIELGLLVVGFVMSTTLGILGGDDFMLGSGYFTYLSFSSLNFAGLYAYTVLLPLAFIFFFIMSLMIYKMRAIPAAIKCLYFGLTIGLGITAIVRAYIAYDVGVLLECGVFCFSEEDDDNITGKIGLKYLSGLMLMLVMLPLVVLMVFPMINVVLQRIKELAGTDQDAQSDISSESALPTDSTSLLGDSREDGKRYMEAPSLLSARAWKIVVLVSSLFLFFPFILVLVMYFPSSFEYFIPSMIRSNVLTCSYDVEEPPSTTISLGDAIRFEIGGACLKFWPDLQIFYFAIYATAVVAIAAVHSRELRTILHSRPKFLWGFSLGESFVVVLFSLMLIFEFIYWYTIRPLWNNAKQDSLPASERLARTMGQLANMVMGLLVFPLSRNNLWTYCLGLGWESMLWFHQLLGDVFLAITFIHIVSWCVYYDEVGYRWFQNLMYNTEYHSDNFTISLQTWIVFPFFVTQGILTMSYIRRNYFEVFYYAHHLFMALFISTLWHANSAWYYLLPGLVLWFFDRILRTFNAYGTVKVLNCKAIRGSTDSNVTMLSYVVKPMGFPTSLDNDIGFTPMNMSTGQYAFINIPSISGTEWHPFSISSSPGDMSTTHHIKDMGEGTWTNKLHTIVRSEPKDLTISVDGPYGSPFTTTGYRKITLVAGGIGITAAHSIFKGLFRQPAVLPPELVSVELIWVMKDKSSIDMFKDTFEELGEKGGYDGRFVASFFVTGNAEGRRGSYEYKMGRPDIYEVVRELAPLGMEALVWHCGPKALGDTCAEATMEFGVDYKNDSFEF